MISYETTLICQFNAIFQVWYTNSIVCGELNELYTEADDLHGKWAGHIARMKAGQVPRMLLEEQLFGTRIIGRPRLRWLDGLAGDARSLLDIRNWRAAEENKEDRRLKLQAILSQS